MNGELQCLKQKGFQYKQPVTDIAEIRLPTRFKGRPGTYKCIDNGSGPEDLKPCRFNESQQERQHENQHVKQTTSTNHSNDEDKQANDTAVIAGGVCGIVVLIILGLVIMVMYKRGLLKRRLKKHQSKRFSMDSVSLLPPDACNYAKLDRSSMTFPRAYSSQQDSSKIFYKSSSPNFSMMNEKKSLSKKTQTL